MADNFCLDCKRPTQVVCDHSTGDTICLECGLVLESHYIDETSEWRSFADSAAEDNDPNRVGAAINPLLADVAGNLTTVICTTKSTRDTSTLSRLSTGRDQASHLINAFASISHMADRLSLVQTIRDRASEIFKRISTKSCSRVRNRDAVFAACLSIACQQENLPRTLKEICSVANGATKTEIGRSKSAIMKELMEGDNGAIFNELVGCNGGGRKVASAGDYVKRFCSNLGIRENKLIRAAQEAARVSEEEFDVRRSPISIAAVLIYVLSRFSKQRPSMKEISAATGVSEGTIRNAYKDVHPYVDKIVPSWFADVVDLRSLSI